MPHRRSRLLGVVSLAIVAFLLSASPGRPAAAAAAFDDGIDVRTASTYTLDPAALVVRVTVDVAATNTTPSRTAGGVITRTYFAAVHLALQPEATTVRATSAGRRLGTSIDDRKEFRRLAVTLPARLYYQQTARVRVTYLLPGAKPRSISDIRVGQAYASFTAWVNGDRASVRIVVPDGYHPTVSGATLSERDVGGRRVLTADGIADPATWYATVDADRPNALALHYLTIPTGEAVVVRAWPEDGAWAERVSDRLERGLPALDKLIGLPWPVVGELLVTEVHSPLLEGYAGFYHPDTGGIEVSEELDDLTILHEASHAWFDGVLFDGRWINEGLADTYATKALAQIGITSAPPYDYPRSASFAFALDDWPPLGRIADDAAAQREDYGYQTSFRVVQSFVTAAGDDAMRKVFAAAAANELPYVGAPAIEHRTAPPDWRTLLDYLDERAAAPNADALFREYVATPSEVSVLATRAAARERYAKLVADGQGWLPGYAIRSAMTDWRFDTATTSIAAAESVLDLRDQIAAAGAPIGLAAPGALREAYQNAYTDLTGVQSRATQELKAATAIATAARRVSAPRDLLTSIGLIGVEPATMIDTAKAEFEADRIVSAESRAEDATATLDRAAGLGAQAVVGLVVTVAGVGLVVVLAVRRRRALARAPAVAAATAAEGALWGPGVLPAGTLPSQPDPEPSGADRALEPTVSEPTDVPSAEEPG